MRTAIPYTENAEQGSWLGHHYTLYDVFYVIVLFFLRLTDNTHILSEHGLPCSIAAPHMATQEKCTGHRRTTVSYVRLRRTSRVSSRCGDGVTFLYGEREEALVRLTEARAANKGDYEKKKKRRGMLARVAAPKERVCQSRRTSRKQEV